MKVIDSAGCEHLAPRDGPPAVSWANERFALANAADCADERAHGSAHAGAAGGQQLPKGRRRPLPDAFASMRRRKEVLMRYRIQ